jgi:gliding motility-associated-like protein
VTTAVKYQWDFGNGDYSDPLTSPAATYTYRHQGIYHPKLLLTDANDCTVIIPINDTLTVLVDSIGVQADHAWPDGCDSSKITFATQGNIFSQQKLGKTPTYFWDFGDPRTVDDISDQQQPTYHYTRPGTYYPSLTVSTLYGCRQMLQDTVVIPDSVALKVMAAGNPTVICQGASVQLSAASNRDVTYTWTPAGGLDYDNQETVKATPAATTTYVVTASTTDKCQTDTAAVRIIVHDIPQVSAGQDQTVSTGSVVQLQATGSTDVVDWSWKPADYLSCTHCADPLSTPRQPVTYTLTGTTGFGCSDSAKMTIHLVCDEGKVFIPNTFTPNGDGTNDLFYPRGRGVKTVLYFRIFDRYGQLIFERTNFSLNDKAAGWDGTYKGRKLDPAVFVYSTAMICDNNQLFKLSGNITLLR